MKTLSFALLLIVAPLCAQSPFPPIPGFNVGLNPHGFVVWTTWVGRPAFYLLIPGNEAIASFHDPALLSPVTIPVVLDVRQWAVFEPNACAVGAGLFFDTQAPLSTAPVATVATTGWNILSTGWAFAYANEPFHSTWHLGYCGVAACTSPCGSTDQDPDWEIYLLTVR